MSATGQSFTNMLSEILEPVALELSIFTVTVVVAVGFQLVKRTRASNAMLRSKAKNIEAERSPTSRPTNRSPFGAGTQTSTSALSRKVASLVDCATRRQAADAIAIYEEMRLNGEHMAMKDAMTGKPAPADVFSSLVQCAGRVGRPELVEDILDDMVHLGILRSLNFYESTMKMLASKKCYKEAMSVCTRLEADGLEPSPVTLSCLINFAVEMDESDRAIGFYDRLAATGQPSIRACMTILRVYSKRHDWAKSLAVIRDMQQRDARIDSLVLNIVLATGVAAGQLDAAKALLHEFSQKHIADVVSYNTLMKGFAQQKKVDLALKLLGEMYQVGVKPNAITFNTAMDAAVRSSRVVDAWRVLARMRDAGLAPDKFTCTTLMKGLQDGATSEQLLVILDLLRNVTSDCDSTLCGHLFRRVIELAAQVNDPDLTARAIAQMREQRVMLSPQEYQRLLQDLMRDGEHRSKGCRPTTPDATQSMRAH
jgi:pentatricopeptide repeat protein